MLQMGFATSSISEWRSVDFAHFDTIAVWIGLAILGGFSLGLRLPWSRTVMVLLLLYLALTHVRNKELLGIIAPWSPPRLPSSWVLHRPRRLGVLGRGWRRSSRPRRHWRR